MFHLQKTHTVEVAHTLPDHPGKCRQLHGHSVRITVYLDAKELNAAGMVADFGDVKAILDYFDHRCLNDLPEFATVRPTSENLAIIIVEKCAEQFGNLSSISVEVQETENNTITLTRDLEE
jgi:6-pyruvoyltetrahydropterin/6-carboxytetrahydropterin synthase